MKLFPQDLDVVLYETGFENDYLNRKTISKQLSDLVEKFDDPVVIALDDIWGSGKTYFLKRWVAAHRNENDGTAHTVYFDAFQSDYLSDPLVSIIDSVCHRIPEQQGATLERWKNVAAKLSKPALGVALSLATFGAKEHLDEIGDVVADAASSEVRELSNKLWTFEKDRKAALESFRELLIKITKSEGVPIVIVVDELDRCRPDYAISILEIIKHLFSVPKVHFILGVNGAALEAIVGSRYGSNIDAKSYLQKFINISFSLPRIAENSGGYDIVKEYGDRLTSEMGLPKSVSDRCVNLMSHVAAQNDVSLREVGKVMSLIALLPSVATRNDNYPGWTDLLCVLLVSSVLNEKFHIKVIGSDASNEEIAEFLGANPHRISICIDGKYNSDYDQDLAIWFLILVYTSGSADGISDENLLDLFRHVPKRFDSFGMLQKPRKLPARLQREWVDTFRSS